ncbi:MAG TPA: nitrate reductase [Chloroflexi bacterium]|nr:nitrate reductase [Chloroflexota bacterium]
MDDLTLFAQAFRYPYPGQIETLYSNTRTIVDFPGGQDLAKFAEKINALSLSDQEELYTRTLDLSPLTAPYVGYHVWGESYKRGEFMAILNKEMKTLDIDLGGELPDHLLPVLRYLHATPSPLPELIEILDQSLNSMIKSLKKGEEDNPYLFLFEALKQTLSAVKVEA